MVYPYLNMGITPYNKSIGLSSFITKYMTMYKWLILSICLSLTACNSPQKKLLENQLAEKQEQVQQLEDQLEHLQNTNSSLLDRMADMSIINKTDAESIRGSISSLNTQFDYINKLSSEIERKDSINSMLAQNLKSTLIDINDEDVEISVKGSAVMVSLSDKMLFRTASSTINQKAYTILKKVAQIINDNEDIDIIVEGHTDDIPIDNNNYQDNWDLSVNRATSVVRLLQENFNVDPSKMTAAGRSEYTPKTENSTSTGRSQNRRTEIIIKPRLDQFFKLLESPELIG